MALSKEHVMGLLEKEADSTFSEQRRAFRERDESFGGVIGLVRRFITRRGRWRFLNDVIQGSARDLATYYVLRRKIDELPTQPIK